MCLDFYNQLAVIASFEYIEIIDKLRYCLAIGQCLVFDLVIVGILDCNTADRGVMVYDEDIVFCKPYIGFGSISLKFYSIPQSRTRIPLPSIRGER